MPVKQARYIYLLTMLIFLQAGFASDSSQNLSEMQTKLKSLQREISDLERQLTAATSQLKNEVQSLETTDRQIALIDEKISLYRRSVSLKRQKVRHLESQVDSLQSRTKSLEAIFKQQIVFAYKYQRGKHLDWLLGSSSFNQAMIRYRYFQKASAAEKTSYDQLRSLKNDLGQKEIRLNKELEEVRVLLIAANNEENTLEKKRDAKSHLIRNIKQDKTLLSQALNEKRAGYEELSKLIASLEKSRPTRELKPKTKIQWEKLSGSFLKNKGKLNWPVQGNVMHGFGRYKNPELKTVLNNTGIDIKVLKGSQVRCIFSGVVSLITYLSGFGNTIIVDHNDGYYSVYAHIEQIFVNPGEFVEDGAVIGTVGETGSLEGPKLHFEIYGNDKPLNPKTWLK